MPNALDIAALEVSFDLVAARGDALTGRFYARLFALAPAVRPLFANTDMTQQKRMLFATLGLLRRSLRNLDALAPALRDLGAKHVGYGALPEHYPVVGQAMVAAMADVAGSDWEPRFAAAWTEAFDAVAALMIEGARERTASSVAA